LAVGGWYERLLNIKTRMVMVLLSLAGAIATTSARYGMVVMGFC